MMKHDAHDDISVCEECGASVYKEHLESGIARYEAGRLLCSHCVAEYESAHDAAASGVVEDLEPIELDEDDEDSGSSSAMSSTRIHSASEATLGHGGAAMQFWQPPSLSIQKRRHFLASLWYFRTPARAWYV